MDESECEPRLLLLEVEVEAENEMGLERVAGTSIDVR